MDWLMRPGYERVAADDVSAGEKERVKTGRPPVRARAALLLILCLGTGLYFGQGIWQQDEGGVPAAGVPAPQCSSTVLGAREKPMDNVWTGLTVLEVAELRKWLQEPARGLNLTRGDEANLTDNLIDLIEILPPPKAAALAFYAGSGPKPERYARAVIRFGGRVVPVIESLKIGPLPLSLATKVVPLHDIYHRPIVPFNARGFTNRDNPMIVLYKVAAEGIEHIVEKLFGGTIRMLPNDTLAPGASAPFSFDGSWQRSWAGFRRIVAGGYLHPLPLWIYTDTSGTDPSLYKASKVVYRRQVFQSKEEFIEAYNNGTLEIESETDPTDLEWSTRKRVGPVRDLDHLSGPRMVSFSGPRFRLDEEQRFVSWMGWEFYMGFGRDMGLSLWNIKFLGDRIIYELAPQEAMAQYSGSDPRQGSTSWLDSYFGMGASAYELIPNYDCPHGAVYLSAVVHASSGSMENPRAICIFEMDTGKLLTRHLGFLKGETGAVKDYVLVVRTVSTVGNYDYTFDYTFMLDGTLEVRVSASGYLQGGYWDPERGKYGMHIHTHTMGSLHDHVINFKVDFDIVNERNSMLEKTTHVEEVHQDWLEDDWGPTSRQQHVKERIIKTEDESRVRYHANFQGAVAIINQGEKNAWGVPRGYQIVPGHSPVHLTAEGSKRLLKNVGWAKDNIMVTRHKETEPRSSSAWNQNLPGAPTVEFDKFFDGESIEQEDIVAWINVGTHHLTQSEDVPNTRMNTASSSFVLQPLNMHDHDVSIGSANAMVMNLDRKTGKWTIDEYGVKEPLCAPSPPPPVDYGHDTAYDLDGNRVTTAGSDWLRANVWPYLNRVYAGPE